MDRWLNTNNTGQFVVDATEHKGRKCGNVVLFHGETGTWERYDM